jgi:hypothetical protein
MIAIANQQPPCMTVHNGSQSLGHSTCKQCMADAVYPLGACQPEFPYPDHQHNKTISIAKGLQNVK